MTMLGVLVMRALVVGAQVIVDCYPRFGRDVVRPNLSCTVRLTSSFCRDRDSRYSTRKGHRDDGRQNVAALESDAQYMLSGNHHGTPTTPYRRACSTSLGLHVDSETNALSVPA
ncbi:hypothetical protein C8Q76DRAFT_710511 [Earliella scabrosa]|nr:hypothetical protein C8Q76DRAFT_710511 [Earliella scabrosa]